MIDTPDTHPVSSDHLRDMLDDSRARTIELTADLPAERRLGPKLDIVNPPQWEIGHVGFFYDHFVLHHFLDYPDYQIPNAQALYDSMGVPHDDRWDLGLPTMAETLDYLERIRNVMSEHLPTGTASPAMSYVWQLAVFHEDMHAEAFTYSRQTLADSPPPIQPPAAGISTPAQGDHAGEVSIPAGSHRLGADADVPFRFDNEKLAHDRQFDAFQIDRAPVTNAQFARFVAAGGYSNRELWTDSGWAWREAEQLTAPVYWRANGSAWEVRAFDRWQPMAPNAPVSHVSFHEANAYCRWAGRRLPTELEWEVAASREPDGAGLAPGKRLYPWGAEPGDTTRANTDGYQLGCADVAAYAEGDSPLGCRQMLGNVWEWTASPFAPYPGFQAELYADYSEPWFKDGRMVLRGGSWATRRRYLNNNTRNFFPPGRNDLVAGFRTCAC